MIIQSGRATDWITKWSTNKECNVIAVINFWFLKTSKLNPSCFDIVAGKLGMFRKISADTKNEAASKINMVLKAVAVPIPNAIPANTVPQAIPKLVTTLEIARIRVRS